MNDRHQKNTLLVMAAGLGSRYGGNKQIDPLGPEGEILMEYSVYDALKAGFNKFVFVIRPDYQQLFNGICKKLSDAGAEAYTVYQDFSSIPKGCAVSKNRVKPLGTVHAVLCAEDTVKEPFAIVNADDFYGAESFKALYSSLRQIKENEALLVTYMLKNTITRSGTVTRAVCDINNNVLKNITETYEIGYVGDTDLISDKDGNILSDSLSVSMNMWGFHQSIFKELKKSFVKFLTDIGKEDLKSEYAIPHFASEQISSEKLCVSCISTQSRWFGVTYKEDRDAVVKNLTSLHDEGKYPPCLKY